MKDNLFVKNINTGLIFPAHPNLLKYAAEQQYLVVCDENGNKIHEEEVDPLEHENEALKAELAALKAEKQKNEVEEVTTEPKEPMDANKMEVLVTAIGSLDKDNPDHWVHSGPRAGKPRCEALEVMAGVEAVTAAEADEAWSRFNA